MSDSLDQLKDKIKEAMAAAASEESQALNEGVDIQVKIRPRATLKGHFAKSKVS